MSDLRDKLDLVMPGSEKIPTPCQSCGMLRASRYCPSCGERSVEKADLGLLAFLKDAFHFQTHMDNRVVATLGMLLRHPGAMTEAWIQGRRRDFAKPIQLFVVVNLVFFLLAPKLGILLFTVSSWTPGKGLPGLSAEQLLQKQAELGYSPEQMVHALNHALDPHKKWFFLILIPLATLLLWCLHPRRRVVEHLVFAIHHASCVFLYLLGLGILVRASMALDFSPRVPQAVALGVAVALVVYLFLAIRRVYGGGWVWCGLRALLVLALFVPTGLLAQWLAFYLALKGL